MFFCRQLAPRVVDAVFDRFKREMSEKKELKGEKNFSVGRGARCDEQSV